MSRRMWTALGVIVLVAFVVAVVHAQAPGFTGTAKCKMCHGMMHKPIVEGWSKTGHSRALLEPSDPNSIVADFSGESPIKKEDIKYILGTGRNQQAFVGADFQVLPAMWDVKAKKWVPTQAEDASTQCIGCHVTGYDAAAKKWVEKGVTCESCHGPGAAHAQSGDKTKIANPGKLQGDKQMAVCAQCHARGTDTTKKFAWPATWKHGDAIEPHFLLAEVVPGAMNQQYNELKQSKHFTSGITCTACHEPHGVKTDQPAQLKKPVNELCLGCHAGIPQDADHPQVPEGVKCSMCHMPQGMHTFKVAK